MGLYGIDCLLLAFILFSLIVLASALDTITSSSLIQEPQTISSNNSRFTLGFFSPQNSTNRYLGIWFMSESHTVWEANRNNPLMDSSGILTISENGNLVVINGQKHVLWSTNVSHVASNSSAQLLDSGNLVLADGITGAFVWQSFQHPCNALLQDMKLSINKKTGEKVKLISWKTLSDAAYGGFSCSLEPRANVTELFVWKGNHPYWRSGPWNGTKFLGVSQNSSVSLNEFKMKGDEEGNFDLYFHYSDNSVLLTLRLSYQGKIRIQRWNSQSYIWEIEWLNVNSDCDIYGHCGPFGICNPSSSPICSCLGGFEPKNKEEWGRQNWTSGCVRRETLQCEKDKNGSQASKIDEFIKLERVKLPDRAQVLPFDDFKDSNGDCQTQCLKNCSCLAYAYDRSLGCMVWNADLLDIQNFSAGGVDFYMRLAHLEQGEMHMQIQNKRRMMQVKIQELPLIGFRKLAIATNNFDLANKLGQGGFGPVYKGMLRDGKEIAVKRLSRLSGQGMEEFMNEVELISKLQHRNLVRLLGCCIEGDEEILVYEYMPNKSLDAYIFDPLQQKSLDWGKRFNIIEGIARGLLYLHRDSRLRIIHRDLKASNILLDEQMNPKISDFGIAKLFEGGKDQANTTRIVGTYGYISPEYATEGLYSEKSDVFSFGVLLLEIISGRKNTSFYEDIESLTLLGFAWKLWIDANIVPLIDPHIYDPIFHKDILRYVQIGLLCVQELAKERPTMAIVLSMLQSEIIDIPSPSQPAFILRQTLSHTSKQVSKTGDSCSINNVTISKFVGR
ncbi:G-type lectin S-receptor-like serine/threonine-protein kinase SD1-13 isoform X2 [Prosopis cineraria]|uniref:G-type lectin S-receptor-like serine/threonine-protein kinase SD1-13 isoform X2 n=1 Tax=Prosopis cineraria TaxID=364024 RepID=UPI00240FE5A7|nr:G-type lectin S-receptor-like serine/threonine-protein kinase SD1-13 isoform X2 [Prosopis cineraria]